MQGIVYRYTDWQTTRHDFRHFLLDHGADLLLYQSMLRIAVAVKDMRQREMYLPMRDEALTTFMNADQDAEYGDARQDFMAYKGIYR